jgi:hypothetical protein
VKLVIFKGRPVPAWNGGPFAYRGVPRLAIQVDRKFWRLDVFGRVFSSATLRRRNERNDPLFRAHREQRRKGLK